MKPGKIRLRKIEHPINGISWRIEVKKWYGWVIPSITYAESATFYDKDEANKWYDYLSGKSKIKETLIRQD